MTTGAPLLPPQLAVGDRHLGGSQQFASKVDMRAGDIVVGLAGDSTGDESPEWFSKGFDQWLAEHPWLSCQYAIWNDATGSYTVSTKQTSNVAPATVWSDTFTRTVSDLYGSTPDSSPISPAGNGAATAQTWGGASNAPSCWSLNGTKAVATTQANPGLQQAAHGTPGDVTVTLTNATVDTSTQKNGSLQLFAKYVNGSTNLYLYLSVGSTGTQTWGIQRIANGKSSLIAAGTGNPIAVGSATTFNMSITVTGLTVTGTINGTTVTGALTGDDAQVLSASTIAGFSVSAATMAGVSVDAFTVSAQPGMQNVRLWNGSKSGSRLDYQVYRLTRSMYPEPIDLLFISSSHNYTTDDIVSYRSRVQQFIENYQNFQPRSGIVLVSQNPEFPPSSGATWHNQRIAALRQLAAEHAYGYLPGSEAFTSLPDRGKSLTRIDGVHPNASSDVADPNNGSYLWATVLRRYLDSLSATPPNTTFGFTFTSDPGNVRGSDSIGVSAVNGAHYLRVERPCLISKIDYSVSASSGNICFAAYRNTGTGRSAQPGAQLVTTGAFACPGVGPQVTALPYAVYLEAGDWLAISADNTTARIGSALATGTDSTMGNGRQYRQASAHPLPSTPSTLVATIGYNFLIIAEP